MRRPSGGPARVAVAAYGDAPRGDRFHVLVRWLTCPFPAVEAQVPPVGRVLEVGCGHGLASLYLAVSSPRRTVVGVDVDAHKVALGRAAADRLPPGLPRPDLRVVPPGELPDGPFDAVVVVDVLYLLPDEAQRALLAGIVARLAPGGVVVIKEADDRPRWKALPTVVQERLATRVLRITDGDTVHFAPAAHFTALLADLGLATRTARADRGYLHPHVVITAARPG